MGIENLKNGQSDNVARKMTIHDDERSSPEMKEIPTAENAGASLSESVAFHDDTITDNSFGVAERSSGHEQDTDVLLVFGYASLLWYPNFDYVTKTVGYVKGYVRRFYQQSETHRGTREKKGRCATIVPEEQGTTWGIAYEVRGKENIVKASDGLFDRETRKGGYTEITTLFYPRDGTDSPFPVKMYIATRENRLFHEEPDLDRLASQIVSARGLTGESSEYLLKTADYVANNIPEDDDEHIIVLAAKVRALLA